jgi:RNA polymerase sigma factor (sigma-70 family)
MAFGSLFRLQAYATIFGMATLLAADPAPAIPSDRRSRPRPLRPTVLPPAEVDQLILENLRLAYNLATIYARRGRSRMGTWARPLMHFDDMRSEATIGLINAARGFDPAHGVKFSTYAWTAIERRLQRVMLVDDRFALHAAQPGDEDNNVLAAIPDRDSSEDMPDPEREPLDAESSLAGLLGTLPDRLRQVLVMRFGLDGAGPKTLGQVGSALGLCRESIRQMERKALRQLRRSIGRGAMAKARC